MAKYLKRDNERVVYKGQEVQIDGKTKNTFIKDVDGKKVFVIVPKDK